MRQWARRGKKPGKSFLEIWEEEWAGIAEHDDGDIRQILFPEWDELPPPPPAPERSQHPTAHLALRPHLAPPTDFGREPSMPGDLLTGDPDVVASSMIATDEGARRSADIRLAARLAEAALA